MDLEEIRRKIIQFLNLGIVGLFMAVLLYDKLKFPHRDLIRNIVLLVLALLFAFIVVLFLVRSCSFLLRAHMQMVLGRSYEYTCLFHGSDGTLSNTVRYSLRNFSFSPQRTVFNDSEGFAVPTRFSPKYFLERRSALPDGRISIIGQQNPIPLTQYEDYASGITIHQGMWGLTVDPPLQPFESLVFVRNSVDEKVERRAFGQEGTDFVFRCRTPFIVLSIVVHAPTGHRFEDVRVSVDTQSGKRVPFAAHVGRFREINRTTLTWRVLYPHPALRYKIHFSLVDISRVDRSET